MENAKAWTLATIFGSVGVVISAAIFFIIMYLTNMILGIVAIGCGMLSGGAAGLGYRLGKGNFHSKREMVIFLWMMTLFGLLGVTAGYFTPYLLLIVLSGELPSLSGYISLLTAKSFLFIVIGAYGGRWSGKKIGWSIVQSDIIARTPIVLKPRD